MKKQIKRSCIQKKLAAAAILLLFTFQSCSQQTKPDKTGYAPVSGHCKTTPTSKNMTIYMTIAIRQTEIDTYKI